MSTLEREAAGPGFLVVEDDELVARWLVRVFHRFRKTTHARTVAEGRAHLLDASQPLAALITDINLPDGIGLDVVRCAREARPTIPVLVLTSSTIPKVVNNAFLLGASFLVKPTTEESLEIFARKALAAEGVDDARVLRVIDQLIDEWSLTDREAELLTLSLNDRPRAELATARGVSENTTKTQVKNLLRKSGARNLDHLVRIVLKRALGGTS